MKQMITAITAVLLLCSSPIAFAQGSTDASPSAATATPEQAQSALDTLKNMSPEDKQQLFQNGVSQVQNMSPEAMKQVKAQLDSMTPEQKQQLQAQIMQQLQANPQLKAQAEQQLQKMSPEQQQQLMDTYQKGAQ